jgi:RNA polymerase sigma factor (sigma-70 family)
VGGLRRPTNRRLHAASENLQSRIDRARLGDREAIADLYSELSPGVFGYLRGAGARDPEDLAGDVFVAMMRGIASFEGDEAALRRWVFTIAHHRLVDARRRETTRAAGAPLAGWREASADDSFDRVLDQLDAAPAVRALAGLTPEQREAVLLRSVVGLSVADTASVLEKSPGAVKTLHRRALASLARAVSHEVAS